MISRIQRFQVNFVDHLIDRSHGLWGLILPGLAEEVSTDTGDKT